MNDAAREFAGIRAALSLKQAEMALLLGVTQATISRWERGIDGPDTRTMIAVRSLLAGKAQAA